MIPAQEQTSAAPITSAMGQIEQSVMMPKPLMPVSLLPSARAMPTPSASTRGAVTVPVVMPPASQATPIRSRAFLSNAASSVSATQMARPGKIVTLSDLLRTKRTMPLIDPRPTPAAASSRIMNVRLFRKSQSIGRRLVLDASAQHGQRGHGRLREGRDRAQQERDEQDDRHAGLGRQRGADVLAERHDAEADALDEEHQAQHDRHQAGGDGDGLRHALAQHQQLEGEQEGRDGKQRLELLHEPGAEVGRDDRPDELGCDLDVVFDVYVRGPVLCHAVPLGCRNFR